MYLFKDMPVFGNIISYVLDIKLELFAGLLLLYLVQKIIKSLYNRPNIPGPFPWPIIGNVAALGDQPQYSMQAMARKYGPVYLMKLGNADVLVLNDYTTIKEALGRQRNIFVGRPQFDSFAKISQGKGIVFNSPLTQGENWHKMKTSVVRHLHKYITSRDTRNRLSDHIRKESIELVRCLDELCRKSPNQVVEPEDTINVSLANIVCALMFGHRYDNENKEFKDLVSLNRQFGEVVGAGSQVDVMPWIKVIPSFKRALKTFAFLTDRLNNWMLARTKEHRRSYEHHVTRDLVDTFIAEGIEHPNGLMKDDIIMALTTDVFGAAQDTLSTTVQWVFIYMMYYPEVQKKVHQELDSVLGSESLPNIFDKRRFPYTEAVMHEVFRHSTFTSTTIPHTTTSDTMLGGYHIPKNILVFINQFAANHDPKYWPNPDNFCPERFLNDKGEVIRNAHEKYLLFSTGSRKCPGDELSRLLILQLIITVFSLCEVQSDPDKPTTLDAVYNLSMRPKDLRTKVIIRKPRFFNQLVSRLSHISPHIPTVSPHSSSFDSSVLNLDSNRNIVHAGHHKQTLEFSDDENCNNKWSVNDKNSDYRKIRTFRNGRLPTNYHT